MRHSSKGHSTCALMLLSLLPLVATAEPVDFNIRPQAMSAALAELAAQSGLQVIYNGELVDGKSAPAVQGLQEPAAALQNLLRGSGLGWQTSGNNSVIIERLPKQSDALELGATTINGLSHHEDAYSPIDGYIARRTSTGTKTDTPMLENPQAISVVTRERMEDLGAQKLDQALRYTAGVRTDSGGSDNAADNPFLRGYAISFTYRDGLRLRPVGFFGIFGEEVYGLERIEVLKGPTSVLYGQSAPGGMINSISKRPTDYQRGEVALVTGTGDRKQAQFDSSGPLNEDGSLLYRFVALGREADGNFDYTDDDRVYVAPSLTWKPDDQTQLTLLTSYQKNKALASTNIPWAAVNGDSPHGRVPMHRFLGEPGFDHEEVETWSLGYEFSHQFNDTWGVRQNVRYSDFDNQENYLARASGLINGDDGSVNSTIKRSYQLRHAYGDLLSLDNQLQANFSTGPVEHTALFGVDYSWSNSIRNERWGEGPTLNVFNPNYGSPVDTSVYKDWVNTQQRSVQTGFYVQDQLKYGNWVMTLGGRQDEASSRTKDRWTGQEKSDQNWSAFTGRAGLVYLFDNGFAPYISYSESFNPVSGTTSPARGSKPMDPETGKQYEVGIRYQPPGSETQITLSVYDLLKQNALTTDPDNWSYSVQTGETRSKGVELEALTTIADDLKLTASYSYSDVKVTKANDGNEGNRLYKVPAQLASAWLDYSIPFDPLQGLSVGLGARYTGYTYGDAANTFKVPSYTLLDAAVRYDLGKLDPKLKGTRISVNASNLSDRYYVASCFFALACNMGEGRKVVAELSYRW
ncbi:MAG: TonB-dependent siderophore receptor [Pseudomonas sp.]